MGRRRPQEGWGGGHRRDGEEEAAGGMGRRRPQEGWGGGHRRDGEEGATGGMGRRPQEGWGGGGHRRDGEEEATGGMGRRPQEGWGGGHRRDGEGATGGMGRGPQEGWEGGHRRRCISYTSTETYLIIELVIRSKNVNSKSNLMYNANCSHTSNNNNTVITIETEAATTSELELGGLKVDPVSVVPGVVFYKCIEFIIYADE